MLISKNKNAFLIRIISVITTAVLLVLMVPQISLGAVTYIGSGTKKDPYLVTNAQQLDGMRNKLDAHYKLAATIDMSKFGDFEPIGFLAKPFKGTFTCDIAEDGLPYYAIKNLSVYNKRGLINKHAHATGYFPDYVKDNSHWEAGLFGATDGAAFKGIFVLDASVKNSCVGELSHTYPNGDKSKPYIPCVGPDENATGVLVAIGNNTTIEGCRVSGTIDSMSNHTGGMVGSFKGGSAIYQSSADVDVRSKGCWGAGGLIGSLNDVTIQYCYTTGDVDAPMKKSFEEVYLDLAGGLFGSGEGGAIISDCYTTGTISFNGSSFAPIGAQEKASWFTNCFTLSKVAKNPAAPKDKNNKNSCYVLAEAGCKQGFFSAASYDELNAAFKGLEGWKTGAEKYPTLSGVVYLSSPDVFVAGAERDGITPPDTKNKIDAEQANSKPEETNSEDIKSGSENAGEDVQAIEEQAGTSGEKQILMIVLSTMIVAISVLTSVVFITILIKIGKKSPASDNDKFEDIYS